MRLETDFNDPYIHGERMERIGRLGQSPEEHVYLHKTLDEAVADLQRHGHFLWAIYLQLLILSIAVVALLLMQLGR